MNHKPLDCADSYPCVVTQLDLGDIEATRLKSMGIFAGQTVELTKRGNPIIVKVAGGRIAISQAIAQKIFVRDAAA